MQLSDVKHLHEAYSATDANKAIRDGWTLLAVVPFSSPSGPRVTYVLGKDK